MSSSRDGNETLIIVLRSLDPHEQPPADEYVRGEIEVVASSQTDKIVLDLPSGTNTITDAGNRAWFLKQDRA